MEQRIRQELFDLGILSNKKGYMYIIEAVKQFNYSITMKEIFGKIAESTGKTRSTIEFSIRNAIKTARHELPAWGNYDYQTVRGFIATMYDRTREENVNE